MIFMIKEGNGISSVVSSNNVLFLGHVVPIVYYESVCFILLHFLFFIYFNKNPSLRAEIIVISVSCLVSFFCCCLVAFLKQIEYTQFGFWKLNVFCLNFWVRHRNCLFLLYKSTLPAKQDISCLLKKLCSQQMYVRIWRKDSIKMIWLIGQIVCRTYQHDRVTRLVMWPPLLLCCSWKKVV